MIVDALTLKDGLPDTITTTMSIDEARYLAVLAGTQTFSDAEDMLPGSGGINHDVYAVLTESVFHRYWDGSAASSWMGTE